MTKAEALRQAQLALLAGTHAAPGRTPTRGQGGYRGDPARPYAHPFFWAPFILMGNWL
jgi:CHAT domain-containing protein